jgi:hypothetical protein
VPEVSGVILRGRTAQETRRVARGGRDYEAEFGEITEAEIAAGFAGRHVEIVPA